VVETEVTSRMAYALHTREKNPPRGTDEKLLFACWGRFRGLGVVAISASALNVASARVAKVD
jgi:hypothetical protein